MSHSDIDLDDICEALHNAGVSFVDDGVSDRRKNKGLSALARASSQRVGTFIQRLSLSDASRCPTLEDVDLILTRTGEMQALELLCERHGLRAVTRCHESKGLVSAVLSSVREVADVCEALELAQADDEITAAERAHIHLQICEAERALQIAKNALAQHKRVSG